MGECSQLATSEDLTVSDLSTEAYQPTNPAHSGPRSDTADGPPVFQGATGLTGGQSPHPQAVSSVAHLPPSQGSRQTSPEQGQGRAAGQLGADDASASAQVQACIIWVHAIGASSALLLCP